jgi:hypothetical protein
MKKFFKILKVFFILKKNEFIHWEEWRTIKYVFFFIFLIVLGVFIPSFIVGWVHFLIFPKHLFLNTSKITCISDSIKCLVILGWVDIFILMVSFLLGFGIKLFFQFIVNNWRLAKHMVELKEGKK